MKLKTLAMAVAVASVPFAAQADLKISGDVGVGYFSSSEKVQQFGSEVNFDASEKFGNNTYYGHAELETTGNVDEIRVGAKGGWGEIILGDADNACNQLDIGGTNEINLAHSQGGCVGASDGNIIYKRSIGNFAAAASHNPNEEQTTFGLKGTLGRLGVSLGYEIDVPKTVASVPTSCASGELEDVGGTQQCVMTGPSSIALDGVTVIPGTKTIVGAATPGSAGSTALENNLVLGVTGKVGPLTIGFRGNKLSGWDGVYGINALYSAGPHNIYGGWGTNTDTDIDSTSLGYKHTRGNTDFVIEAADSGVMGADTDYAIGMRHRF